MLNFHWCSFISGHISSVVCISGDNLNPVTESCCLADTYICQWTVSVLPLSYPHVCQNEIRLTAYYSFPQRLRDYYCTDLYCKKADRRHYNLLPVSSRLLSRFYFKHWDPNRVVGFYGHHLIWESAWIKSLADSVSARHTTRSDEDTSCTLYVIQVPCRYL